MGIVELWLPILLSAVFVFIVSSIVHMALPIHRGDFGKLPEEDKVLDAIRDSGAGRGEYMFPCAESMKDMGSPEMVEKLKRGPVGYVTLLPPGGFALGKSLIQWFVLSIVFSVLVAYTADIALDAGAAFIDVFRLAFTVAFCAYGATYVQGSIWKGVKWSVTWKFVFDGALYALTTAATFAWLWPAGAGA